MYQDIVSKALEVAATQLYVRENPLGSNRGPEVDAFIRSVGLDPVGHYSWCAAFVYWCFSQASSRLWTETNVVSENPCPRTGSAQGIFLRARPQWQSRTPVIGGLFVLNLGHGAGHIGFVTGIIEEKIGTLEGNTNIDGSSNGIGVFRRERTIKSISMGFVNFN